MASLLEKLKDDAQKIEQAASNIQRNLNKRLDGLYFRVVDGNDFDTELEEGIYDEQISFVIRDEDTIELWKGSTKVSGSGGGTKRAVAYAISPDGWDFKMSDSYVETTTTKGTTYILKPEYDENGLLIGGPYIVPGINIKKATTDASFTGTSISVSDPGFRALWYPNTDMQALINDQVNLGTNYTILSTSSDWVPSTPYEITELNKCAYDSFAIHIKRTQDSEITSETVFDWDEYILFKVFVGAVYASQAVTQYLSGNTLNYGYIDNDWDVNGKKFDFYVKPCVQVRRFYGVNPPSGVSTGTLIEEGYFYFLEDGSGNRRADVKAPSATDSIWLNILGYGIGIWSGVNQQSGAYELEFGGCGLVPVYGNDVDTYPGRYGNRDSFYFNNDIKPRIGFITNGAYLKNDGACTRLEPNEMVYLLCENNKPAQRLGLDYGLTNGEALPNWAMDVEGYRYNGVTYDILKHKNERTVEQ